MKRLWVADLLLAVLLPLFGLTAFAALVSSIAPEPYEHQYFVSIEPIGYAPLVLSFLLAAAWSYRRPSQALWAQLVPIATLAATGGLVAYLFAAFPAS